jgi:hypothetical protein
MLLVVKTRLCFVTLASLARANIWIVLSGCPPSSQHKKGQAGFTLIQGVPEQPFPVDNAWVSCHCSPDKWWMSSICSVWPWLITENWCSCLLLYQVQSPEHAGNFLLPPWKFNLRTSSPLTMSALCDDLEFTALPYHMLTKNLYSYWALSLDLRNPLF